MYQLLEREWSTSLFHCDPESCILAHVLPCHIYAKLYDKDTTSETRCYLFNFIYYGIFSVSLYNVYYWLNYINKNRCPLLERDYCFNIDNVGNKTCNQYYMLVNGIPSKCIYNEYEICTHSEQSCFIHFTEMNTFLSLLGSVSYIMLCFLHFFLRDKVKKDYSIQGNYDISAIFCSTCGLAQEYREYEVVINV